MKVSVIMTTYNHEDYIATAIESVLGQEVNFDFELLVGEDDSKDNTRAIVRKYAEKHPNTIRAFFNNRENVIHVDGKPTGRWNFINLLRHAKGEHIALLEGDDYWIGENKLQIQVDHLEMNPNCAIAFNNAICISEDGRREKRLFCRSDTAAKGTIRDLIAKNYIPTCTVIYRKNRINEMPDWFWRLPMGDWPLHLINSQYGTIDFLPEPKGAYRKHAQSAWSQARGNVEMRRKAALLFYDAVREHFGSRFEDEILTAVTYRDITACLQLSYSSGFRSAINYWSKYLSLRKVLCPEVLRRCFKSGIYELSHITSRL